MKLKLGENKGGKTKGTGPFMALYGPSISASPTMSP
jgi:hypothetical protein